MSTGLNCHLVEFAPNRWYYILQNWDCPAGAFSWYDYATACGPFSDEDKAYEHLRENHANPGGYSSFPYKPDAVRSDTLKSLIANAEKPVKQHWRIR